MRTRAAAAFIPLLTAGSLSGCPEPTPSCVVRGTEVCNGVDDDCNGLIDDGVPIGPEICNGEDDDCDGTIDEGVFGVLSGPWLIAENIPRYSNVAASLQEDGGLLVTWATWASAPDGTEFKAWYALHAADGLQVRFGAMPVPYVEGVETVALGSRRLILATERTGGETDGRPHRLLLYDVDEAGALSEPVVVPTAADADFAHVTEAVVADGRIVTAVALADFGAGVPSFSHVIVQLIEGDGTVVDVWPSNPPLWTDARGKGGRMAPTADGGWRVLWTDTDDRRQFIFYSGPTALPIEGTTAWLDWTNLGLPEAVAAGARIRNDDLFLPYSTSYGPAFEHDRMLSTYVVYGPDGMTMTDHGLIALDRNADRFVLGELVRLPSGNELPSSMEFAPLRQGTFGVSGTQAPAVDRPPDIVVWHVRDATRLLAALRSPSARLHVPDLNAKLLTTSLVGASAIGGDRVLVVGRVIPVDDTGPSETVERMYGAVLGCR